MSNKIGDYVHYHAINYLKYGINHAGQMSGKDAASSIGAQRLKIQNSINTVTSINANPAIKQELSNRLKWLMNPSPSSAVYPPGQNADIYNELWNMLLRFFEEEFGDAVNRISRSLGNVLAGVDIPDLNKIRLEKDQKSVKASTIMNRIQAIQQAYNNGYRIVDGRKIAYSTTELGIIENTLNKVYDEILNLRSDVAENLTKIAMNMPGSVKNLDLKDANSLVQTINSLAALGSGTTSLQKGTLFEWMIAVTPLIGKNLGLRTLEEAVRVAIGKASFSDGTNFGGQAIGWQSTEVQFDPQLFSNSARWEEILGSNYKLNDNLWIANKATQDKVDVVLQLEPGQPVFNISAKNVNLSGYNSRGVTLVSGTSFLQLLSNMDSDFATHYLNQHVLRVHSHVNVRPDMYSGSQSILNLSILEQALRGFKKNAAQADVFLINDNVHGTIHILDMGEILSDFMNENTLTNFLEIDPAVDNMMFPMVWAIGSYSDRITKILAAVHSVKITVHLRSGYFLQ